jgi:hypothetical protein
MLVLDGSVRLDRDWRTAKASWAALTRAWRAGSGRSCQAATAWRIGSGSVGQASRIGVRLGSMELSCASREVSLALLEPRLFTDSEL